MNWSRLVLALTGLFGATGVVAMAAAAHGLSSVLDPIALSRFQTAAQLQLLHALALLAISPWLSPSVGSRQTIPAAILRLSSVAFSTGIVCFSGSLYALALTGNKAWSALAPFGGFAFLVGWITLIWPLVFSPRSSEHV